MTGVEPEFVKNAALLRSMNDITLYAIMRIAGKHFPYAKSAVGQWLSVRVYAVSFGGAQDMVLKTINANIR